MQAMVLKKLWLGYTCHVCPYCMGGQENLCDQPVFTGYTRRRFRTARDFRQPISDNVTGLAER